MRVARASLALLIGIVLAGSSVARAAGIHAALTPELVTVQPGETFSIDFSITATDASFNAFDAVVEYDPAAVTFLPVVPSALQQGTLMTGSCGSTFHLFSAAADSLKFTSGILCAGVSQTGPGQLYRLNFQAGASYTDTWIRLRPTSTRFFSDGIRILPVETADAMVRIMDLTGVGDAAGGRGLSLRAAPNPVRAGTTFTLVSEADGPQSLTIYDLRGRVVRAFDRADAPAGVRLVAWDGRDDRGIALAAGVYRAVLRAGARQVSQPVVIVP
jgi:hypothetical protein